MEDQQGKPNTPAAQGGDATDRKGAGLQPTQDTRRQSSAPALAERDISAPPDPNDTGSFRVVHGDNQVSVARVGKKTYFINRDTKKRVKYAGRTLDFPTQEELKALYDGEQSLSAVHNEGGNGFILAPDGYKAPWDKTRD